jgi:hypothetical protein
LTLIFFFEGDKVRIEENSILVAEFKKEIKKAIYESYSDGAPGPHVLSFMFYKKIWRVIKEDLIAMFKDFSMVDWICID